MSDNDITSRNFYWLHLSGGDYNLLEPYKKKEIPLKLSSRVFIKGSTYEIEMRVKNTSKNPSTKISTYENNFVTRYADDCDFDVTSTELVCNSGSQKKQEAGLLQRIYRCVLIETVTDGLHVSEMNRTDVGVAFFLHFSIHAAKREYKEGEDTRILPIHYSNIYFSLVLGESMHIKISFEVPSGVTSRVTLKGWNYHTDHHHSLI